jgi:hypothetical protein
VLGSVPAQANLGLAKARETGALWLLRATEGLERLGFTRLEVTLLRRGNRLLAEAARRVRIRCSIGVSDGGNWQSAQA